MNLQRILQLSGVIAVVLLLLQFLIQMRRIKRGHHQNVGRSRVFINWLLIIIILVGFGGGGYLSYKNGQAASSEAQKSTTTKETSDDQIYLAFKKKVHLNSDGKRRVTFAVSSNTRLKIVGHYSKTIYKEIDAKSGKGKVKMHYTFDDSGTYDVIAIKGDQKVTKKLVVKDHQASSHESSSESSSAASSSSATSSSSSSHSSTNSSTTNNNNSGSTGSGSSYSGGGGSSYSGGGGSSYTPSRPATPSRPSTPSAPSNGTGAMTGGGY